MGAGPDDEVPIVSTELYHSDFDAFVKVRARSLPSRSICQLVPSRSLPGDGWREDLTFRGPGNLEILAHPLLADAPFSRASPPLLLPASRRSATRTRSTAS